MSSSDARADRSGALYEETLTVPLRWWAVLTMFLASVLLAFLVATPLWLALAVTGILLAALSAVLLGYGSARIVVRDGVLYAGGARIAVALLGTPVAHDAPASRRIAGMDADARAFLLLRPYARGSVQVSVEDPTDPTPYWLVSSRSPERLVQALLTAGRTTGPGRDGYPLGD